MLDRESRGWRILHQSSIAGLLVPQALQVESLLNEHTIELAPSDDPPMIVIGLIEQSKQTLINLLLAILKFPLPRLEMLDALRDELIEGELIIVLLECILEESKDVLVDVYG